MVYKGADDEAFSPVVMEYTPLVGETPESIREKYMKDPSEHDLAAVYAAVSNQVGWLMHDLDDEDCPEDTEQRFNAWAALEEELRGRIFEILKREDITEFERSASEGVGYYFRVMPFMIRNGFRDGAGWWVET